MFEASHSFAFFDYFRVPYEARTLSPAESDPEAEMLGSLRPTAKPDRSLMWFRNSRRETGAPPRGRLGCYRLRDITLFGHVLLDHNVSARLECHGRGWRPVEPILAPDGRPVAAVWRDAEGSVFLPFDPGEVMQQFWTEEYRNLGRSRPAALRHSLMLHGYYSARPLLPRQLQIGMRRIYARVQGQSPFPRWPIEDSLHNFYGWLFALAAELAGNPVPYIDLWPQGRTWALVLTHDVETERGYRNMEPLSALERERGYHSSWNFVPLRYSVDDETLCTLRQRGCEVGVHGLKHDGRDLASLRLTAKRLPEMRAYAERWNAFGFRSPATQRRSDIIGMLGFNYDSSYSDTDPYGPHPGGCCTYLPYFNEDTVELPMTLPQDHTLFSILDSSDTEFWVRKAQALRDRGAMVLVLTHPDYARDPRVTEAYRRLLDEFCEDDTVWRVLPMDVAAWWRRRAASTIYQEGDRAWAIEGPAAAEAQVRLASADGSTFHQRH